MDEIHVQAKKHAEGNGRNFVDAIDVANTTQGVCATPADLTKSAEDYVKRSPKRIILINGKELARLIQCGVGVRIRETHQLQRIDDDCFETGPA